MLSMHSRRARAVVARGGTSLLLMVFAACADAGPTAPAIHVAGPPAAVQWNARARRLVEVYRASPVAASRAYAMLAVAQYDASVALRHRQAGSSVAAAERLAIAAAAARVLGALFPSVSRELEDSLDDERSTLASDGLPIAAVAVAEDAGARAAAWVLDRALTDGADAEWTGTVPTGLGLWHGSVPLAPLWGRVTPWLLTRGDQFRAPPPPAVGSMEFAVALNEVRRISATRTSEQLAIALLWADGTTTATPPGHWNAIASDMIVARGMSDHDAVRVLALLDMAMADAMIACWDTKYTYWMERPWEADPRITTPIGRPPHPSYPSGHSCSSSAGARVLGAIFPAARDSLEAMRAQAALSRIYAGVHFRFDVNAGTRIGSSVAGLALRAPLAIPGEVEMR